MLHSAGCLLWLICHTCIFVLVLSRLNNFFPYMQPTQGWLFNCHNFVMSPHRVVSINVMSICWLWWTPLFAFPPKLDLPWSIIYVFGYLATCLWIMLAVKGNFYHLSILSLSTLQWKVRWTWFNMLYCGKKYAFLYSGLALLWIYGPLPFFFFLSVSNGRAGLICAAQKPNYYKIYSC